MGQAKNGGTIKLNEYIEACDGAINDLEAIDLDRDDEDFEDEDEENDALADAMEEVNNVDINH